MILILTSCLRYTQSTEVNEKDPENPAPREEVCDASEPKKDLHVSPVSSAWPQWVGVVAALALLVAIVALVVGAVALQEAKNNAGSSFNSVA